MFFNMTCLNMPSWSIPFINMVHTQWKLPLTCWQSYLYHYKNTRYAAHNQDQLNIGHDRNMEMLAFALAWVSTIRCDESQKQLIRTSNKPQTYVFSNSLQTINVGHFSQTKSILAWRHKKMQMLQSWTINARGAQQIRQHLERRCFGSEPFSDMVNQLRLNSLFHSAHIAIIGSSLCVRLIMGC